MAYADPIEDIQILKISAKDQRMIVKDSEGKIIMLKLGDAVGNHGSVVEITDRRIVIDELTSDGMEKVIIAIRDKEQKITRIRRNEDEAPLFRKAVSDQQSCQPRKNLINEGSEESKYTLKFTDSECY